MSLNKGLLSQGISTTKYCRSPYHFPDFCSAINNMLVPEKRDAIRAEWRSNGVEDRAETSFYDSVLKLVLEVIELEDLIKQCEFDVKKGATPPVTAAVTRWGTAFGALAYLYFYFALLAFAIIKVCGHAIEAVKINAAADVLKPCGFNSSKYQNLRIEDHARRPFAFVTGVSSILQLAIGYVLNSIVEKPLLAALSSDNECGTSQAMALESKLRCIIMVLSRDIWVRCFPRRSWGSGWNHKMTLGFRTHGAEFDPDASLRLLNPRCADKVRRRLSNFPGMDKLVEAAARAIPRFLETVEMLARRPGQMLPEDSLELWKAAYSKLKLTASDSVEARKSQAQWLLGRVAGDCVAAIVRLHRGMHRELFGVSGFIANMGRARKTDIKFTILLPDGSTVHDYVVIPDVFARANAACAYVLGRDLMAHYRNKGLERAEVLKRLPTYCRLWSEDAMQQLLNFICQFEGRDCKGDGAKFVDSKGAIDEAAHSTIKRPLSSFPLLDPCSNEARACVCNSKAVESSISPLTVVGRGKGNLGMSATSAIFRRRNFITAVLNPKKLILKNEVLYYKAKRLALRPGWKTWVDARDEVKGDQMRDAAIEDKLPQYIKRGESFEDAGHGGLYRMYKFKKSGSATKGGGTGKRGGRPAKVGAAARKGLCVGKRGDKPAKVGAARKGRGGGKRTEEDILVDAGPLQPWIEEVVDASLPAKFAAKRVRVSVRETPDMLGDRLAPRRNGFARVCLAKRKAARRKVRRSDAEAEQKQLEGIEVADKADPSTEHAVQEDEGLGGGGGLGRDSKHTPLAFEREQASKDATSSETDRQDGDHQPPIRKKHRTGGHVKSRLPIQPSAAGQGVLAPRSSGSRGRGRTSGDPSPAALADADADADAGSVSDEDAENEPAGKRPQARRSCNSRPSRNLAAAAGQDMFAPRGCCVRGRGGGAGGRRGGGKARSSRANQLLSAAAVDDDGDDDEDDGNVDDGDDDEDYVLSGERAERYTQPGVKRPWDGAGAASSRGADDDDDKPLFPDLKARSVPPAVISAAASDPAQGVAQDTVAVTQARTSSMTGATAGQRKPAQSIQVHGKRIANVYGMSFCFEAFGEIEPDAFQKSIARWNTNGYLLKRRMPTTGLYPPEADISFRVECSGSLMCYLAYTGETGVMLFYVSNAHRPKDNDWSRTVRGYQIHSTDEALSRVVALRDVKQDRMAVSLGANTLQYILGEDRKKGLKTYHPSDVMVALDVRCIIGVVRTITEKEREYGFNKAKHKDCPEKSDIICIGDAYDAPAPVTLPDN